MYEKFYVGAPTYFVVKDGYPWLDVQAQNMICAHVGCEPESFAAQMLFATQQSEKTRIATTAMSWIDDYFDFLGTPACCCADPPTAEGTLSKIKLPMIKK